MTAGVVVPRHFGSRFDPWPPGVYWLVEIHRINRPVLNWTADYDDVGRVGVSYLPQRAAGYATKEDAETAARQARELFCGAQIIVADHVWAL